jgi:PAS domain S-box-containing protein
MRSGGAKCFAWTAICGLAVVLGSIFLPPAIEALLAAPPLAAAAPNRDGPDRCQFLMAKVSAIVLSLDAAGRITFLNHYGQSFFGYSEAELLGKPMLGTLTPAAGFEGRDLRAFLAALLRDPNDYAYSVNVNMRRDGERVWVFWANKGIYDDQGKVEEVLRVGLDISQRESRLEAATQQLRGIAQMVAGRDWIQRRKLKEITDQVENISRELERPWRASKAGVFESVAPPGR